MSGRDFYITPHGVLKNLRIGRNKGQSAEALCDRMLTTWLRSPGADERALRKIITKLRAEGHHICGHPSTGYYIAADETELLNTCQFLYQRAMTSLKQVAAMRRVSLPDLAGQLRLKT